MSLDVEDNIKYHTIGVFFFFLTANRTTIFLDQFHFYYYLIPQAMICIYNLPSVVLFSFPSIHKPWLSPSTPPLSYLVPKMSVSSPWKCIFHVGYVDFTSTGTYLYIRLLSVCPRLTSRFSTVSPRANIPSVSGKNTWLGQTTARTSTPSLWMVRTTYSPSYQS